VPNRPAVALALRAGDREELLRLTRSSSVRAGLAQRARIVLLASDGVANTAIAQRVGVSRPTVTGWRARYAARGMAGLDDEPRSGRPRHIDHRQIVAATLRPPRKKYGVTHWSSRLLGRHLRIGDATVARAWREYGVQPWRAEWKPEQSTTEPRPVEADRLALTAARSAFTFIASGPSRAASIRYVTPQQPHDGSGMSSKLLI
jgi:transposase